MIKKLILIPLLLVAACSKNDISKTLEQQVPDQCLRRELFNECMKSLPAGPVATHYNDWDDVVSECRAYAWSASVRYDSVIKKECQ